MQQTGQFSRRSRDIREVFQSRAFRLFSIGNFSSLTAIWIVRVCAGWLTWEMTASKTWLGLVSFAELGPSIIISLYAGALADRHDRMKIVRFGQGTQTLLALMLVWLIFAKALTVWWLLVVLLGFAVIGGLTLPARMALPPVLLPREHLATATAVGSMSVNLTRLLGPLLAAPLLAMQAEGIALLLAAIGFAVNAVCMTMVRDEDRPQNVAMRAASGDSAGFLTVMADMLRDRSLRLVLALQFLLSLLVRPLTEMFPAYADVVFGTGEAGYGALNAAVGIGAIVGAVLLVGEAAGRALRYHILMGAVIFAVSSAVFSFMANFWVALTLLFVFGMAMTTMGIAGTTYVQVHTPLDRLGRVMSVYSLIFRFAPALGALSLGAMADIWGLRTSVLTFAVVALVFILACWRPLVKETA